MITYNVRNQQNLTHFWTRTSNFNNSFFPATVRLWNQLIPLHTCIRQTEHISNVKTLQFYPHRIIYIWLARGIFISRIQDCGGKQPIERTFEKNRCKRVFSLNNGFKFIYKNVFSFITYLTKTFSARLYIQLCCWRFRYTGNDLFNHLWDWSHYVLHI